MTTVFIFPVFMKIFPVETESSQRVVDNKSDDEGDAVTDISDDCDLDELLSACGRILPLFPAIPLH